MDSQKVVIPAQADIQSACNLLKFWIPAFAGMTKKLLSRFFADPSTLANFHV
jgi:hypothetical protein